MMQDRSLVPGEATVRLNRIGHQSTALDIMCCLKMLGFDETCKSIRIIPDNSGRSTGAALLTFASWRSAFAVSSQITGKVIGESRESCEAAIEDICIGGSSTKVSTMPAPGRSKPIGPPPALPHPSTLHAQRPQLQANNGGGSASDYFIDQVLIESNANIEHLQRLQDSSVNHLPQPLQYAPDTGTLCGMHARTAAPKGHVTVGAPARVSPVRESARQPKQAHSAQSQSCMKMPTAKKGLNSLLRSFGMPNSDLYTIEDCSTEANSGFGLDAEGTDSTTSGPRSEPSSSGWPEGMAANNYNGDSNGSNDGSGSGSGSGNYNDGSGSNDSSGSGSNNYNDTESIVSEDSGLEYAANAAWPQGVTTVMIRNIACRITRRTMAILLNELGFTGKYDGIRVPKSSAGPANLGYAFVNFLEPEHAEQFHRMCHGTKLGQSNSLKLCEVVPSVTQGTLLPQGRRGRSGAASQTTMDTLSQDGSATSTGNNATVTFLGSADGAHPCMPSPLPQRCPPH